MSTVYIEETKTPIWRRIAYALGRQLAGCGVEVLVVNPDGFNTSTFLEFISQSRATAYISNSVLNIIQTKLPRKDEYYFENFPGKLIFLHQDAILGGASLLNSISKLNAWKRVADRSAHLCIEPDNVTDLASIGISNAKVVSHATEIEATEPSNDDFIYDAAFVGHVIPSSCRTALCSEGVQSFINETVQLRREDFTKPLEERVKQYIDNSLNGMGDPTDKMILRVASAQWLRNQITGQSMQLRGWAFENSEILPLTIFGGDPAYLHGIERNLQVQRADVNYQPALFEPHEVQRIFNKSKININISSLQFDHAVVNRFHDVIMSGGLCLTDARSGLAELTSVHDEVSFVNLEGLNDRAKYFSRPENANKRSGLIKTIQKDIVRNSGYPLLADTIMKTINELSI